MATPRRDDSTPARAEAAIELGASADRWAKAEYFATEAATARPARYLVRSDLGLSDVVFVRVGRRWWVRGTGPLLAAYGALDRELPGGTSLLLMGDGPDEARISPIAKGPKASK